MMSLLTAVGVVLTLAAPGAPSWHVAGELSEACTCSVPCSCNFGEAPSPHKFCYAIFSMAIRQGSYGDVNLDGLRMAGSSGAKGIVWYIDDRATPEQEAALRSIGATILTKALAANGIKDARKAPPEFQLRGVRRAKIDQVAKDDRNYLRIGGNGVFVANYIKGMDGKPVTVENNWSWNIQHGIKGKTKRLAYHDEFGNRFEMTGTNANQGTFDWSESTPVYFR